MGEPSGTDQELVKEISVLKKRIRDLERSEAERAGEKKEREEGGTTRKSLEALHQLLFDSAPYGVVIIDHETGRIADFNELAHRQLGYSREEFACLSLAEIEAIESPEEVQSHIEKVIREGRDDFETLQRTKQGELRNVHVTAQMTEVSGRLVYHCVWTDVTERKRAREELEVSRNRLSRAEIISKCGNWEFDLETGKVYASQGARRIYGLPDREWTIEEVQKIPLTEYRAMLDEALVQLIREDRPYSVEFRIRRPYTGEIAYIHSVAEYDRKRNVVFGVIQDITDRKRAEEALFESEVQYRSIVENSLAGVFIYQDGKILFVNGRFCEIFGCTHGEVMAGFRPMDAAHPEDRPMIAEYERAFLAGEMDYLRYSHRVVRKDGVTLTVNVLAGPVIYKGRRAMSGTIYDVTEQEKVQEELRQKTALLEAQVNASLDGILVVDQGRKILQNRMFGQLFSIPDHIVRDEDDAPQVEWASSMAKDPARFSAKVAYMFAHPGETIHDELELKNGTVLDRYSGPVIGKDGRDYGRIWTVRDITERKRSEEALRASRVQLAEAMELAHLAYWELDPAAGMFVFNDPFYALLGTTAEREGGYMMARDEYSKRFIHPDDRERYIRFADRNVLESRSESVIIEHRIIRRDGEVRHILARSRIVKDESGTVTRRYGVLQDITERKLMEEEIGKERSKLKTLSDNAPFGMVLVDAKGNFTYVNPKFIELFGFGPSVVSNGREWFAKAFPNARERHEVISTWVEDFYDGKPGIRKSRVFTVTCADGTEKVVSFIVSVLPSGEYLMACEDITELRRLESQLRQAQKMEAIGTLAGGAAHDFNNILTVITGYGTLLKMEMGRENPLQSYVEYILTSAEKATHLTHSLLSFSRHRPVVLTHLNMNESLRSAEKLLKRLLTENIVIRTQLANEDVTIMADATQIDQILFNLATNSRDAMPHGGVFTIEVKTADMDDEFRRLHGYGKPGRYVQLSVSDTGEGMDEATRERIFDPFFTTKEAGKGTGLGLSSVYGTVKQHKGYITVYSEPGVGTTFHIYFPLAVEVKEQEKPAPPEIRGGTETILVAEDSTAVRNLICRILAEYGYTTIEAHDGEEAVERFRAADRVDLLILDSVMPKMSGREAYNEIHQIGPSVRTIFTSGYTRDAILDKDIEGKKFEFISKPISPNDLLRKVREVLDGPVPR